MLRRLTRNAPLLLCGFLLVACDGDGMDPMPDAAMGDAGPETDSGSPPGDDAGDPPDGGGTDSGTDGGTGASLRVLRDDRGVPHIVAGTLEEAMYATGYVHAEDRLFQMQYRRLRMQGRLAEFFAVASPDAAGVLFNDRLIRSDRQYRTIGMARDAERTLAAMDASHRALLEAYAAGVNDQMAERASLGTAFDDFGITSVDPWTAADTMLNWDSIGETFTSSLSDAQAEVDLLDDCAGGACPGLGCGATVIDEEAAIVMQPDDGIWPPSSGAMASVLPSTASSAAAASLMPGAPLRPPVDVKASQGFVVAAEHLAGDRPLIFGEPQLFLEAPSTWYETHVVVESEGIDVRGVGFAGSPGMLLFYGRHVAQTITAGGADNADLFELTETEDGNGYTIDGADFDYLVHEETLRVRGADDIALTVRESRLGPVVSDVLNAVPGGTVLAMRHANSLRPADHSVIAGIELMRADSLESYRDALRHWVSPSVNALYAGVDADTGETHIAYHLLAVIPRRAAQTIGATDVTGRHPADGSQASQNWDGQYDLDWNPHVIDPASGYLFSGNHVPVGAWYNDVLYAGLRGGGDTLRSFELRHRLQQLIDAPGDVDPGDLHALHVDAGSEATRRIVRALERLTEDGVIPEDDPSAALDTMERASARVLTGLSQWLSMGGGDVDQRVPGDFLVRAYLGRVITLARAEAFACDWSGAEGGIAHFLRDFAGDESVMGVTEARIVMLTAQDALNAVAADHGTDVAAWASSPAPLVPYTVAFQRNFECLRPGAGGRCSANPARDVPLEAPEDYVHTIGSSAASSWPFTVDFADVAGARALLAPGVSEEPTSPRFADQLPAIADKGHGNIGAIPLSPLDLDAITVTSEMTLSYTSG
ncbi:MAG: penicillin acylase family protein [Sandaracinaceae bacterium]